MNGERPVSLSGNIDDPTPIVGVDISTGGEVTLPVDESIRPRTNEERSAAIAEAIARRTQRIQELRTTKDYSY